MPGGRTRHPDLREACVREALAIIETDGLERLSLREVARRLGVSHQAPYRHFPSRDHILAEVVSRAYDDFARFLEARERTGDPEADLGSMGQAYLAYALAHPLQYRLMFGTPLPDPEAHPEMMRTARHAFAMLTDGLRAVRAARGATPAEEALRLDGLFVWSALHGLAAIAKANVAGTVGLSPTLMDRAGGHVLEMIGAALGRRECRQD